MALHTPQLNRASVRGKSVRGGFAAKYHDTQFDDEADYSVPVDDLDDEEGEEATWLARVHLAETVEDYEDVFKRIAPEDYEAYIALGGQFMGVRVVDTQNAVAPQTDAISDEKQALQPVITCDLTHLAKHYEARANVPVKPLALPSNPTGLAAAWNARAEARAAEIGDMAWMAFEEVLDAHIERLGSKGFMSVYGVDLFWLEALNTDGFRLIVAGDRVTFYGIIDLIEQRRSELVAIGTKASEIYTELRVAA